MDLLKPLSEFAAPDGRSVRIGLVEYDVEVIKQMLLESHYDLSTWDVRAFPLEQTNGLPVQGRVPGTALGADAHVKCSPP